MMTTCPECGATWEESKTCTDCFHQMLGWESEDPALWVVHHLMVLCYHIQHPSLYSPEGLAYSIDLLVQFVDHGKITEEIRRWSRDKVDSGKRTWKVTARPGAEGTYTNPVDWTMRAVDVVEAGKECYCDSVRVWAGSVLASLRASGNLPNSHH